MKAHEFSNIWKHIVPISAVPTRRIKRDGPDARMDCFRDLEGVAAGRELWLDSAFTLSRPIRCCEAKEVSELHPQTFECVVLFDDRSFWAITEEEYEWFIFEGALARLPGAS
ncbi:MAG: hypothetical protein CL920_12845 [Deltaproteobacteria bacterium]|nr:hypothetical protein [Deltaproteobacteria bacterium]|tara:strand:+ start:998 stop:1333 length:336 start_codon:yes stop_codon:yes gene_type:complete